MKKNNKEEKDENNWLPLGMCIGMSIGIAVGAATNNIGLWLPIGLCLGLSLGAAFSSNKGNNDKEK